MKFKKLIIGFFISANSFAGNIADCYQQSNITPPLSTSHFIIVDGHVRHSIIEEKKLIEKYISSKIKPDDRLYILSYNESVNPEIKIGMNYRMPHQDKYQPDASANNENYDKEVEFEACAKLQSIKWDLAISKAIRDAFAYGEIPDGNIDNMGKLKLIFDYLMEPNASGNEVIWLTDLNQRTNEFKFKSGTLFSDINPDAEILKAATMGLIPKDVKTKTHIQIFTKKQTLTGKQKTAFASIQSFWKSFFHGMSVTDVEYK